MEDYPSSWKRRCFEHPSLFSFNVIESIPYQMNERSDETLHRSPKSHSHPRSPNNPTRNPFSSPSRQPQLPIKRIPIRFAPQEPLQRLHLILTAPLLQHHVPVPPAFLAIHGIRRKDRVEHVGAVDLAGEVAVVAGVVAAEEVAEGRLAVA